MKPFFINFSLNKIAQKFDQVVKFQNFQYLHKTLIFSILKTAILYTFDQLLLLLCIFPNYFRYIQNQQFWGVVVLYFHNLVLNISANACWIYSCDYILMRIPRLRHPSAGSASRPHSELGTHTL